MRKIHFISEFVKNLPKINPLVIAGFDLVPLVLHDDSVWEYTKRCALTEDPRDRRVAFYHLDGWAEYQIDARIDAIGEPIYSGDLIHINQTISKTKKRDYFEVQALVWIIDGKLYWHLPRPSCWGQRDGSAWKFIDDEERAVVVPRNASDVYMILYQLGNNYEMVDGERKVVGHVTAHTQVVKVPIIHNRKGRQHV